MKLPLPVDITRIKQEELEGAWMVQPMLNGPRVIATMSREGDVFFRTPKGAIQAVEMGLIEKLREISKRWSFRDEDFILDGVVTNFDNKDKFIVFDGAFRGEWMRPKWSYEGRLKYLAGQVAYWRTEFSGTAFRLNAVPCYKTYDPNKAAMQDAANRFLLEGHNGAIYRRPYERVKKDRTKLMVKVVAQPPAVE